MFSWYKYLIVNLVLFPISVFGVGILFLFAPFPDLCLLVPFTEKQIVILLLHVVRVVENFQMKFPITAEKFSVYCMDKFS